MANKLTEVQVQRVIGLFVEICRQGRDIGLTTEQLASSLKAMAGRLEWDHSPLDRFINNPHGGNPKAKPV